MDRTSPTSTRPPWGLAVNYDGRGSDAVREFILEAIWQQRHEGLPKLWIIRQALRVRHERPQAFGTKGNYTPLYARGEKSAHIYFQLPAGGEVITIAPRLFLNLQDGWYHTVIDLPKGRWRQEFDGQVFDGGPYQMGDILLTFPVGLLSKME